jgi:hypothetical protein
LRYSALSEFSVKENQKTMTQSMLDRLVPSPTKIAGHWHDPLTDEVHSLGDKKPSEMEPDEYEEEEEESDLDENDTLPAAPKAPTARKPAAPKAPTAKLPDDGKPDDGNKQPL